MANIFEFTNYREYLNRCYAERKQRNPKYSYQSFSDQMGFNNRGFLFNVIKGKRNLSFPHHCFKLSKALKHGRAESDYFELIVAFAQAKIEEERTHFWEKIQLRGRGKCAPPLEIEKEQYEYLSKWYHSAVRSLVDMYPISDNYEFLCRKIFPPITVGQAKKTIALLARLKIIRKGDNGVYRCTGKSIKASSEISQRAVNRFHVECTELAKQSVIFSTCKQHLVSSLTLGISEKSYKDIFDLTMQFKQAVLDIANKDEAADRVYQYQLVLFPLTTERDGKESRK
jgi:uncharacterized protein (TIGR02147 family)